MPFLSLRQHDTPRREGTRHEFLRSLPVSLVTSVIDFGLLILLTEAFGLHYLLSAAIAFVAGQVWAYVMAVTFVFSRFSPRSHAAGFSAFATLSLVGVAVSTALLWTITEQAGVHYVYAKLLTSWALFVLLFFVRKRLLFS